MMAREQDQGGKRALNNEGKTGIFVSAFDGTAYERIAQLARDCDRSFEGELRHALKRHVRAGMRIYEGVALDQGTQTRQRPITVRGLDSEVVESLRAIGFINNRPLYEEVRQALYRHAGFKNKEAAETCPDADDLTAAALAAALRQ